MLKIVLTLGLSFLLFAVCIGQQTNSNQEKARFKAYTEFSIQLESPVYTEKNNVGDDVSFILNEEVNSNGNKIEKGSLIYARIVSLDKITAKNDTAKVCIMFDFVKKGEDFISLVATIIAIEPNTEAIKLTPSTTFSGGTVLSLKSKEIQLDKGKIFRIKLMKEINSN